MATIDCLCACGNMVSCTLEDFKLKRPRSCGSCRTKPPVTPLNGEQSALVTQYHDRIGKFMGHYRLDPTDWYDRLALIMIRCAQDYTQLVTEMPFPGMLWVRFQQGYADVMKCMGRGNGRLMKEAVSLDAPLGEGGTTFAGSLISPDCLEDSCISGLTLEKYLTPLTPLERRVALLLSSGYPYRQAGMVLRLTEPQIQRIVTGIKSKLAPIIYANEQG